MTCDNCGLGSNGGIDVVYKGICDGQDHKMWSHYPAYLPAVVDFWNFGVCEVTFTAYLGSKLLSSFNLAPKGFIEYAGGVVGSFYVRPVQGSSAPNSCYTEIYLYFLTEDE